MRHPIALIGATALLVFHSLLTASVLAQGQALRDLLPGFPDGGSPVIVTNEGSRTPDEYAAIFFDPEEAARLLADWGCLENVYRVYEDPKATEGGAKRSYLQVGVTRFASPDGAAAALPYIVENLRPAGAHRQIPMPTTIGNESRQFVAEVDEGIDLTLLVRSDSLLIGVSTLLTEGDPSFDPVQVAAGIVARAAAPPTPTGMTFPQWDVAPLLEAESFDLPDCLRLTDEEPFDFPTVVTRFPGVPDAATRLEELGWRTGAHRQFTCDPQPAAGLSWLDMSVHAFNDAASATAAIPFFAHARTVDTQLALAPAARIGDSTAAITGPSENGTEYTLYLSTGRLLFRVSAVAAQESPQADVEYVMTALLVDAQGNDAAFPPQAHNLGRDTQATEVPVSAAEDHGGSPYITVDPNTGQTVAIYPDGTVEPVQQRAAPQMPVQGGPDAGGTQGARGAQQHQEAGGELWFVTPSAAPQIAPSPVPTELPPSSNCDPSYPDVCIAPAEEVGDLDCQDVPYGSFRVVGNDPHRFDGPYDGSMPNEPDGIGCEWNAEEAPVGDTASTPRPQRPTLDEMLAECSQMTDPYEQHRCEETAYELAEFWHQEEMDELSRNAEGDDERDREEHDYYAGYGPHGSGT